MTKEVILSITGLQVSPENDENVVETINPGEYYFKNGKHYLFYEEVTEGLEQPARNVIKLKQDYMELTKRGSNNVHMVFEKNKKNVTYFYTPYGNLQVGVDATRVDVTESDELIHAEVDYALEINCEHLANCHIVMDVKQKGSADFRLTP